MRGSACVVMFVALASDALAQPEASPTVPVETPATDALPAPEPAPEPPPPALVVDEPKPPAIEPSKPPAVATDETPTTTAPAKDRGFRFGSYGRVIAGTDLRGGKPESTNVVAYGPRIVEPSYLELDLSYGFETPRGYSLRPVITLAFDGTLFHETGEFDAQPALRNFYLDAQLSQQVTAWVGSRMYRGDDIYLFDFWPLDEQNTVGAGLFYRRQEAPGADTLELAAHAGVNRLRDDFQFQTVDVLDPAQGSTVVTQLNRQRMVASTTASYILAAANDIHVKAKVHGEVHALPSGTRRRKTDGTAEELPSDNGYVVGAQVGAFGFASAASGYRRHVNLFARYAKGLAAFDELAPPTSFGADRTTARASELSFGMSANWDTKFGHLMAGALSRRFIDADAPGSDADDGWEYAMAVRPLARVVPGVPELFVGGELSYQARFPKGLNATTQRAEDPAVFSIGPMIVYSPMGPSGYDRPQLRLVYRASYLNDAAQAGFVPDDPRAGRSLVHFLGVQAEWWFNSTTYR